MAKLVLVVALVSAFVVTVIAHNPSYYEPQTVSGAFDQLIEIAEKILQSINILLGEAVEEVALGLTELLKSLELLQEGAVETVDKIIEDEIAKLADDIQSFINSSGIDINDKERLQCIEDNQVQIDALVETTANYVLNCIAEAVEQVNNDTIAILADIWDVNNQMLEKEKSLESCKSELIPFDCIKNVIDELVELALTLPDKVEADGDKAQEEYDNLPEVFDECNSQASRMFQEGGAAIYNNITACAS